MTASVLKTVLIIIAWLIFLWRGYVVYREQLSRPSSSVRMLGRSHQSVVWVSSFLLLLAGMTWSDAYVQFASVHFGEWFLHVPKVVCGVIGFMVCLYGCVRRILPDDYLRWDEWLIAAGILVIVAFVCLEWIGWHVVPERLFEFQRLAGLLLKSYLLVGTMKVGLPTIRWCQRNEPGIIIRIRLGLLWWFGFFFAAWMSIDIVVLILGLDTESSVFAVPFVAGFLVTFVIGLFVPDRFYKRYLAFFYHLITFIRVRIVELLAYHELTLEHRHSSIAWRDVLQSPEHATYKSVIAVLDSSKLLCAQPEKTLAWSLGHEISSGCSDTSNYLEVVNHLREIGGECLFSRGALKAFSHLFLIQIGQSTLSHAGE